MELYIISQDENNDYDTYDSAVVAAPSEKVARYMNPQSGKRMTKRDWKFCGSGCLPAWCSSPDKVTIQHIGKAARGTKRGVVCASFNAG